jgi:hypothetical protein
MAFFICCWYDWVWCGVHGFADARDPPTVLNVVVIALAQAQVA